MSDTTEQPPREITVAEMPDIAMECTDMHTLAAGIQYGSDLGDDTVVLYSWPLSWQFEQGERKMHPMTRRDACDFARMILRYCEPDSITVYHVGEPLHLTFDQEGDSTATNSNGTGAMQYRQRRWQ